MGIAQRYEQRLIIAGAILFSVALMLGAAIAHFSRAPQVAPDETLAALVGSLQQEGDARAKQLREAEAALDACRARQ